jgi:hypothetical protein
MILGLVIRGKMGTQLIDEPSIYEPLSLKIVSGVGDVYSLPLHGAYYYIFLQKPNGLVFGEILPGTVHRKETLSSAEADEGRYSAILTFQTIFANLQLLPMPNL